VFFVYSVVFHLLCYASQVIATFLFLIFSHLSVQIYHAVDIIVEVTFKSNQITFNSDSKVHIMCLLSYATIL